MQTKARRKGTQCHVHAVMMTATQEGDLEEL